MDSEVLVLMLVAEGIGLIWGLGLGGGVPSLKATCSEHSPS